MNNKKPIQFPKWVLERLKLWAALSGGIAALVGALDNNLWAFAIAGIILLASICWNSYQKWRIRRRRRDIKIEVPKDGSKAYLRGLLPFSQGEFLLGRDTEAKEVLAKLDNPDLGFTYLT